MKLWALGLALVLSLSGINAEAAKRLGGGKSFGKQSSNVTQREATPAAPAAPSQNVNNAAAKPAPAAPAATSRAMERPLLHPAAGA